MKDRLLLDFNKRIAGNYWTIQIGFARTLLALSTFLTLLLNNNNVLFSNAITDNNPLSSPKISLSIYTWFSRLQICLLLIFNNPFCYYNWIFASFFLFITLACYL